MDLGKTYKVLIEGNSKKSEEEFKGRNTHNKMVIFPKVGNLKPGDYCMVKITEVNNATLKGVVINN